MKVLVAINFDEIATEVEDAAFKLLSSLNSEVILLNVVDRNISYQPVDVPLDFSEAWQLQKDKALDNLSKIIEKHPNVKCSAISVIGDPKTNILRQASEANAAIIVLGTHGRTGISGLLIGSTAEYIVRHSPIPVLVVPFKHNLH